MPYKTGYTAFDSIGNLGGLIKMEEQNYNYYIDSGCGALRKFTEKNPEFSGEYFSAYVSLINRADRDSGE